MVILDPLEIKTGLQIRLSIVPNRFKRTRESFFYWQILKCTKVVKIEILNEYDSCMHIKF